VRANREYRLLHTRGGRAPSRLAAPGRFDQVEIVEISSGETILLWDVPAREAPALLRALRADLSGLEGKDFIARWRRR
jgi:hypothetical protein